MVVLPYKDRLALFPKYLQQLIMESLGKELDLDGRVVNQDWRSMATRVRRTSMRMCSSCARG